MLHTVGKIPVGKMRCPLDILLKLKAITVPEFRWTEILEGLESFANMYRYSYCLLQKTVHYTIFSFTATYFPRASLPEMM
jgi:hypothetical protein